LDILADLDLHAGCDAAVQQNTLHLGVYENAQVRPIEIRTNIGLKDGMPLAVADDQVGQRGAAVAFHHQPILAFKPLDTHGLSGLQRRQGEWARVNRRLNPNGAVFPATGRIGRSLPALDVAENRRDGFVGPDTVLGFAREMIPIVSMTMGPQHDIHARAAAKDLAAEISERDARKAAAEFEKEQKWAEAERRRDEVARERDRERREKATAKAQAALDEAKREHAKRAADIQAEVEAPQKRARTEDDRWEKERERLQAALRRARE
jgi:hypothetical protein